MGSTGAKAQRAARRAKIEEMRRADKARDRRNRIITVTVSGFIIAGLIGGSWYLIQDMGKKAEARKEAASAPVKGEQTFENLGRNHVTTPVTYPMSPPAGGDHNPRWMNCNGDV